MLLQNVSGVGSAVSPPVADRSAAAPKVEVKSVGTRPLVEPSAIAEFDAPPAKEAVVDAARAANIAMAALSASLSFEVDGDTHQTVVKVIDTADNSVIRQIPSKEMLEIARALDRVQGLLLKGTA